MFERLRAFFRMFASPRQRNRSHITAEQINDVISLHEQGFSYRDIAEATGVSLATAYKIVRQHKLQQAKTETPSDNLDELTRMIERIRDIHQRLSTLAEADRRPAWERALDKLLPVIAMALLTQLSTQNPAVGAALQSAGLAPTPLLPSPQPQQPAPQPAPQAAPPNPDDDLPAFLLHIVQRESPEQAAARLIALANQREDIRPAVELLGRLTPNVLDDYLIQLAGMGQSAANLAEWLRNNKPYTLQLIQAVKSQLKH